MPEIISTATDAQWAKIAKVRQKWIGLQTAQYSDTTIKRSVAAVLSMTSFKGSPITVLDSPLACVRHNSNGQTKPDLYWSVWWGSVAGWYEGGGVFGVKYDVQKYKTLPNWSRHCPFICGPNVAVSRHPVQIHWNSSKVLHNEHGMSVRFADGWGLWAIDGIPVDEQIVMQPETQTVAQIDAEKNGDVRSIRIARFGWPRYLKETQSMCIDNRECDNCLEALYRTPAGEQRLVVTCPTGRVFALGVPDSITSCREAQNWLGREPLNSPSRCLFRT